MGTEVVTRREKRMPGIESGLRPEAKKSVAGPFSGRAHGLFLTSAVLLHSPVGKSFLFLCQLVS